jgi:hypothetical protein
MVSDVIFISFTASSEANTFSQYEYERHAATQRHVLSRAALRGEGDYQIRAVTTELL